VVKGAENLSFVGLQRAIVDMGKRARGLRSPRYRWRGRRPIHVAVREYLENFNEDFGEDADESDCRGVGDGRELCVRRFRLGINAFGQLR
jgi:hypothetical protein